MRGMHSAVSRAPRSNYRPLVLGSGPPVTASGSTMRRSCPTIATRSWSARCCSPVRWRCCCGSVPRGAADASRWAVHRVDGGGHPCRHRGRGQHPSQLTTLKGDKQHLATLASAARDRACYLARSWLPVKHPRNGSARRYLGRPGSVAVPIRLFLTIAPKGKIRTTVQVSNGLVV